MNNIDFKFSGDIVPPSWNRTIVNSKNEPKDTAIKILSRIAYIWRYAEYSGNAERFADDGSFRLSYQELSDDLQRSKDTIKENVKFLVALGVIEQEFRTVVLGGNRCNNVAYYKLNVDRLKELTPDIKELKDSHGISGKRKIVEEMGEVSVNIPSQVSGDNPVEVSQEHTIEVSPHTPSEVYGNTPREVSGKTPTTNIKINKTTKSNKTTTDREKEAVVAELEQLGLTLAETDLIFKDAKNDLSLIKQTILRLRNRSTPPRSTIAWFRDQLQNKYPQPETVPLASGASRWQSDAIHQRDIDYDELERLLLDN